MNKDKRLFLWSFFPSILLIIIYLCVYRFLPNQVINHIDISGNITMGDKSVYLYLMFVPLVLSLLTTCFASVNHKKSIELYKNLALNNFIVSISVSILLLYILFIQLMPSNDKMLVNRTHMFFSFLIIMLGLLMPKYKRGYIIGIRTYWTMNSENVWIKTHKLAQITVTISGIIILFAPAFINNKILYNISWILFFITGFFIPVIYSAYLYKAENNSNN